MKTLDGSETILCFPSDAVVDQGPWTGWREFDDDPHGGDDALSRLRENAQCLSRTDSLEADRSIVQAVVYGSAWLCTGEGEKVLVYRRHPSGTEGRLHGFLTVGFGGHVEDHDVRQGYASETYRAAIKREFREEMGIHGFWLDGYFDLEIVGLIHDSSDPGVGAHHLGVVFEARTKYPAAYHLRNVENAVDVVGWWTAEELAAEHRSKPDDFEPWTRLYVENRILPSE